MLKRMQSKLAEPQKSAVYLGVDTCGAIGSLALARLDGDIVTVIGERVLESRALSETMMTVLADLLREAELEARNLSGIVAVSGPGSFTGVRIGLSAVKGLADAVELPVNAVTRLEVLAAKVGVTAAALDAHRREVFLRVADEASACQELLAGEEELAAIQKPTKIAVCDASATALLARCWPEVELVETTAPLASDALRLRAQALAAGECADLAELDGHYLRRSDAEIFGDPVAKAAH